jgi:hypothetical protein
MPQDDLYHDSVIRALTVDGWTITDDPLTLSFKGKVVYVDLGAERTIGAERDGQRIAVEIKSFLHPSDVHDLREAVGQFVLYRDLLRVIQPDRLLYLAVPEHAYEGIFSHPLGQLVLESEGLRLIVFELDRERIVRWVP